MGMAWPGQELVHIPPGLGRVEHGDDVVAAVADDPVGRLGVVVAELAFGEDDEAAVIGWVASRESTETGRPLGSISGTPIRCLVTLDSTGIEQIGCPDRSIH